MCSQINDENIKNGSYRGYWLSTVDANLRLRLNKGILELPGLQPGILLLRFPDPAGKCFVLCPPHHRSDYIDYMRHKFIASEDISTVEKLLACGSSRRVDSQGRISIMSICLSRAGINPPARVEIFGVGRWFEISKK